jgi:hypothetical protein
MTERDEMPSAAVTEQALQVAVHGNRARVSITTAHASGRASSTAMVDRGESTSFWTPWRRAGAFLAGVASLLGAGLGVAQWKGWL